MCAIKIASVTKEHPEWVSRTEPPNQDLASVAITETPASQTVVEELKQEVVVEDHKQEVIVENHKQEVEPVQEEVKVT